MSVIVRKPGLYTSIQDLGRQEYQHIGIVKNGSIDQLNHRIANLLVGNNEEEALIEMTVSMPTIQFTEPTLIAITGANFPAFRDQERISPYKIQLMNKGETLSFNDAHKGTRGYLAIAGGIVADEWLGSKSTSIRLEMGGYKGRLLQESDEIEMCRNYTPLQKKLFENLEVSKSASWGLDQYTLALNYFSDIFHIISGEGVTHLSDDDLKTLESKVYKVSNRFNRTGLTLDGEPVINSNFKNQPFLSVKKGSVILNKENQPVIMLNDHQSLSSYPQLGTIASYHIDKLAQKKQGSKIIFKIINIKEAELNMKKHAQFIKQVKTGIRYKLTEELNK
ncbi:biotin-dependent carboxyltransferase family protein [Mammaliicoccus stepanovicii]|uniref:Allophanate hydrolase subunit 2 family protein n=1 Tax=Mammaliicoccus stepanovicii TaxID=643214 RepID=A0A240A1Y3_9STAP|nr:biotin-dependent carboxyltransferase family protein [Mammaliicoccus stepanovicii]PNZ71989.1 allophanate hydrolase [Mammaliicoccus stepanovicii]GGI39303.1 allophanate hydrolase [Mammaliicoccus stepanovicii]SNV76926.1 allophanate hydrolase subunit 2 family protein [Mammaliicoccus stepanovicii]